MSVLVPPPIISFLSLQFGVHIPLVPSLEAEREAVQLTSKKMILCAMSQRAKALLLHPTASSWAGAHISLGTAVKFGGHLASE